MTWNLWLDDNSFDIESPNRHAPKGFTAAISSDQAFRLIKNNGLPDYISFDHDLGGDDTAMKLLRRIEEEIFDGDIPKPPMYDIHSANPVGSENIRSFMESWFKAWEMDR